MASATESQSLSSNPTGNRAYTSAHVRANQAVKEFRGLPENYTKYSLITLLEDAGPLAGWKPAELVFFINLIKRTQDHDWRPGNLPIVWCTQKNVARNYNVDPSTVRNWQNKLLALGAIAFKDPPNCRRRGSRLPADLNNKKHIDVGNTYGIVLAPIAAQIKPLVNNQRRIAAQNNLRDSLKREIKILRRRAHAALYTLHHDPRSCTNVLDAIQNQLDALSQTSRKNRDEIDSLENRRNALQEINDQLTDLIEPANTTTTHEPPAEPPDTPPAPIPEPPPATTPSTGKPPPAASYAAQDHPPKTQIFSAPVANISRPGAKKLAPIPSTNTKDSKNDSVPRQPRDETPVTAIDPPRQKEQGDDRSRPAYLPPHFPPKSVTAWLRIAPRTICAIAPEYFRGWIASPTAPSWPQIHLAAEQTCKTLGISHHAWLEAVAAMKRDHASCAVALIAAKFELGLITSPGGYLRALSALFAADQLDLSPSYWGVFRARETAQ